MSLARPWWLGALALLLPLVILHLRRPALVVREVPSLYLWERITGSATSDTRRLRRPRHPLLLALQALALCALVVALAGPERHSTLTRSTSVIVVDDSFWMQAPGRAAALRDAIGSAADAARGPVAVVAARTTPAVLYRGGRSGAAGAADRLGERATSADLSAAIALGAGLLGGPRGRLIVLRAPESPLPAITAGRGQLDTRTVGAPVDDQGLFGPQARCGIGPNEDCEVLATLRNGSGSARVDRYTASVTGERSVSFQTRVPARSSATIALTAQPGQVLHLRLAGHDALATDDSATVSLPGTDDAPDAATVLLVGDPTTALPLAQAFASVPGVTLLLRTARTYTATDARRSELVVLDGVSLAGGLPEAPAVLLVAPKSLPGGGVGSTIATPTVSSAATGSALLQGVDLASLNVDRGAARVLRLPTWMAPIVSAPGGPLLAAGDDGHRRLAVLAFDPQRSNLAQLPALPILARNLVGWADGWASLGSDDSLRIAAVPGATRATLREAGGTSTVPLTAGPAGITDLAAGIHTVTATGTGVSQRRTLVSALPTPGTGAPASPLDISSWARSPSVPSERSLTPWLLVLALAALVAEWAVWRRVSR